MKRIFLCNIAISVCLFSHEMVYDLGRIEVIENVNINQNKTAKTIGEENFQDTNSKTVVQALQEIPGVSILKVGKKNLTDVRIRGFDNRRIPIYIDGIPVYVPYNRESDLGRYTTYDLSQISVSKGYVSPMYGPNTLGGAINLVTKKPTKEFEGEVGGSVFSGKGKEAFMTFGTRAEKFYGLLSFSKYQRDYFELSKDFKPAGQEDGNKRENSDTDDFKLNLKVGYTPNDTDEYSFNYVLQRAKKGNPFYASDYEGGFEGSQKKYRTRYWRWPNWDKTSYYFLTKTSLGSMTTVRSRFFYDQFYNELENYGKLPKAKQNPKKKWTSKYDDYSYGGNLEAEFKFSKNHILKAMFLHKNDFHKDIFSFNPAQDIETKSYTQSFGLENSWKINDKLTWVLGASYDANRVTKAQYRKNKEIGEWKKHSTNSLNPQTVLYYQATKDMMVYGSVGQRSNLPTLSNRYSSRFGDFVPNPNLEAEVSMNYEVGIEQNIDNKHFAKIALFMTRTDDYIGRVDGVAPLEGVCKEDCSQYQNIGKEEYRGVEVSLSSYWNNTLSSNLSYMFIDADLKKSEVEGAKHIEAVPKYTFNGYLKYSPIAKLDIIPKMRYESGRYVDIIDNKKTNSFVVFDLKVAYEVFENCKISAGINNIADKDYVITEGHPEEGRSCYISARYLF